MHTKGSKGSKGSSYPSEHREFIDSKTGAKIHQMTDYPSIQHNLYFLTPSFTPDQTYLIFASYRSGKPNFYKLQFPSGEMVQLTDGEGIHGYSGVISKDGKELFFTQGGAIKAVNLESLQERTLASYEGGQLGECSLSSDDKYIVTAMKRDGKSHLVVTAADGSSSKVIYSSERTIIHPQFHPTDPDWIEYAGDPAPRIWMIKGDGSQNHCHHRHGNDEFLVHETFLGDGKDLIFVRWPYALRRMNLASRKLSTIAEFNAWHICGSRDGRYVLCDTVHPDIGIQLVEVATGNRKTICYPNSSCQGSQWKKDRYALAEDWKAAAADEKQKSLSWMEMKVDTVYGPQWTHPHPSFSPDERMVVYTSDVSGQPQVYVAIINPYMS